MIYQEFNKRVFEFYINRAASTFCILSIDTQEMEGIISIDEIREFHILKSDWYYLLQSFERIPQYFGLIAIQCYAASLMHDDGKNAADAYKIRLREILNVEDDNSLQQLFRGNYTNNPIQEEIWFKAQTYLKNEFNLMLEIPSRTIYAGRYVQYPKSQALLTTEDLKYFTVFFSQEFQIKEIIPFEYFKKRLNASLDNIKMSSRVTNLWISNNKKDQCIKQVCNYYNLWEGEIFVPQSSNKYGVSTSLKKGPKFNQEKLLLVLNNGQPEFYSTLNTLERILEKDILNIVASKKLIIFNELDFYQNEYEESSILYRNVESYILLDPNLRPLESGYLDRNNESRLEIYRNKILYKHKFNENITKSPLSKYFQSVNPVRLDGGLKVDRGNEYLKGYGPSIRSDMEYSVIHENCKCNYDPENADVGQYKIRTDYCRDIEINLVQEQQSLYPIESRNKGWNFNTYSIENNHNIEGCLIKSSSVVKQDTIREWIDANLKSENMKAYKGDNILIKAINNSR